MNPTPLDIAIDAAEALHGPGNGLAQVAAACGTSKQFIHKMRRIWRETGSPPRAMRDHAPAIEAACGGAVTVEALCPEVTWDRDESGRVVSYSVPVVSAEAA